jgi:hypothetical protein
MGRRPVKTMTGRLVCAECRDRTNAAAAGVIASPANPVGGAIATEGWFRRFVKARRRSSD